MKIVGKAIEYIEIPATDSGQPNRVEDPEFILDFLKSCDRNVYIGVREHNTKLKSSAEIKPLQIKCADCEHQYDQTFTLSPVDFFE